MLCTHVLATLGAFIFAKPKSTLRFSQISLVRLFTPSLQNSLKALKMQATTTLDSGPCGIFPLLAPVLYVTLGIIFVVCSNLLKIVNGAAA